MTEQTKAWGNIVTRRPLAPCDSHKGYNPLALLVELTPGTLGLKDGIINVIVTGKREMQGRHSTIRPGSRLDLAEY